ncbi:hypothetical protein BFL38_13350 [Brachyspira hampsonii]|uniref:DUF4145 domain-containing protein n=1 Tax=Brachyspira hampsonii TaxID=1287055 RepID=A0A1E5NGL5_9SPIR|nr:hypothetical protein [Brachyspira hampsonii]OEJ15283.1 hypothetical protein BFL38_13350 [Brachyspira hampsonii]
MENIYLTKTEIIDLVVEYNSNDTKQMLYFIENDCNIKFDIIKVKSGIALDNFNISIYCYKLFYNNKKSNKDFTNRYSDDKYCVYNYKAKDVLIELFKLLYDEDIENIKNITLKMKERKHIKENNSINVSSKNIVKNMSDINNYNNLDDHIENRPEMINIITELEKSKENIGYIVKEDPEFLKVIKYRLEEIEKSIKYKMPLTAIILSGSTLEGILLYIANKFEVNFKQSQSSPKNKSNSTKEFDDWTLNNFIDVAHDIGFLKIDVKKLSHNLREFRNYVHPYKELENNYHPSIEVSKIFIQILILAINEIIEKLNEQN